MKPRKKREAQFLDACAGTSHLSIDLIRSARQALSSALDERRDPVARLATTHHSSNAVASIVLVTTALDVSMNEALTMSNAFQQGIDKKLALHDTRTRFGSIASQSSGFDDANTELGRLVELRNEIVHHLPRSLLLDAEDCPEWIRALEGVGISHGAEISLSLMGCPQPASLAPSAHCSACLPPIFASQAPLRWGRLTGNVVANPRPMLA